MGKSKRSRIGREEKKKKERKEKKEKGRLANCDASCLKTSSIVRRYVYICMWNREVKQRCENKMEL